MPVSPLVPTTCQQITSSEPPLRHWWWFTYPAWRGCMSYVMYCWSLCRYITSKGRLLYIFPPSPWLNQTINTIIFDLKNNTSSTIKMDKAKAAVGSFLNKDGKHDTTVHEVRESIIRPVWIFLRLNRASIPPSPTRTSFAPNIKTSRRQVSTFLPRPQITI